MGYIYKITNDINDKVYIGKTEFDIEKRFKEHYQESFRQCEEKRPLYNAINKYGIEHFKIELIEECDNLEEREKYWIEFFDSYYKGYNATLGGDGKTLINYDLVVEKFQQGMTITQIAKEINKSPMKRLISHHMYAMLVHEEKDVEKLDITIMHKMLKETMKN